MSEKVNITHKETGEVVERVVGAWMKPDPDGQMYRGWSKGSKFYCADRGWEEVAEVQEPRWDNITGEVEVVENGLVLPRNFGSICLYDHCRFQLVQPYFLPEDWDKDRYISDEFRKIIDDSKQPAIVIQKKVE